jgi:biopolymer transport protein ExbB/TolQ
MYVIFAFLVAVIALGLWRGYLLFMVFDTPNPQGMWSEIYKLVANNQIETGIRLCEKAPRRQILPRVWKKGLQSASRTADETQNAVDSATLERLPLCNRYLNWFGTIANITTLLGLLGTISGLITSFSAVATLSGAAKQTKLAEGISHALYATGFGLGTALVAMVVHGLMTFKANKVTEQTDEFAAKLIELLQMRRSNLASKASGDRD